MGRGSRAHAARQAPAAPVGAAQEASGRFSACSWKRSSTKPASDPTYRKVIEKRDGKAKEGKPDSDDRRDRDRGKPRHGRPD